MEFCIKAAILFQCHRSEVARNQSALCFRLSSSGFAYAFLKLFYLDLYIFETHVRAYLTLISACCLSISRLSSTGYLDLFINHLTGNPQCLQDRRTWGGSCFLALDNENPMISSPCGSLLVTTSNSIPRLWSWVDFINLQNQHQSNLGYSPQEPALRSNLSNVGSILYISPRNKPLPQKKKMLTQKNLSRNGQSKQISDANLLQKKSINIKETALLTISNPMLF